MQYHSHINPSTYLLAALFILAITITGIVCAGLFFPVTNFPQLMLLSILMFLFTMTAGKMTRLLLRKGAILALRTLCLHCNHCRDVWGNTDIIIQDMCKLKLEPEINEKERTMRCVNFDPIKENVNAPEE